MTANQLDDPTPCASWGGDRSDFAKGDFMVTFTQGAQSDVTALSAEGVMDKFIKLPFGELPGSIFGGSPPRTPSPTGGTRPKQPASPRNRNPALAEQPLAAAQASIPDAMLRHETQPFGSVVGVPASAPAPTSVLAFSEVGSRRVGMKVPNRATRSTSGHWCPTTETSKSN